MSTWLCMILKLYNAKIYGISIDEKKASLFKRPILSEELKNIFIRLRNKTKLKKIIAEIKPEIIIHLCSVGVEGYKSSQNI